MRQILGMILSLALHLAVVGVGYIYLPSFIEDAENVHVVPIELVSLAANTNVRAQVEQPEPEPELDEPDIEDPIQAEPEPVEPEPQPETEPEPIPLPPEQEDDPVAPEAEPEPEPVEPDPQPEPEPQPRRQEPAQPSLSDLLNLAEDTAQSAQAQTQGQNQARVGAGTANTANIRDLMFTQVRRCWRMPADAPNPEQLGVTVSIRLERNGTLAEPPRLHDEARVMGSSNPYLQVAGERAVRAVVECQPYRLPPEDYSQWRSTTLNFRLSL